MQKPFLLTSAIVFMCSAAFAEGTVELPAKSKFVQLKLKSEGHRWRPVDIPEIKSRKVSLAPGEYEYVMTLRSAVGTVSGSLTVEDGSYIYIHRAVSPDSKRIASWASAARPRSEQYEIEAKERFCLGVFGYAQQEAYMVDACSYLAQIDNVVGLFGLGYIHENGVSGTAQNSSKASDYYMRAYNLGHQEAGAAYFILNQNRAEARDVLFELADEGHAWSVGVAGQILSTSQLPEDRQRSRAYAEKSLKLSDPAGFKTLSTLAFSASSEKPNEIVEAAAWFNLYNLHKANRDFDARRLKAAIEDFILAEDQAAIKQRTIELEQAHGQTGLYLLIDTSVLAPFKDQGRLTLLLDNDFKMPVKDFESRYALPLWWSKSSYSVSLNIDDQYVGSTTFLPGDSDVRVRCLVVRPEDLSLRDSAHEANSRCPQDVGQAESVWVVLNQFM